MTRIREQATFLRQAAEWGMRVLQGSFPRLKDTLLYLEDMTDRRLFLHLIPMVYNFRTQFVGLNQIRSTFYPIFEINGDHSLNIFRHVKKKSDDVDDEVPFFWTIVQRQAQSHHIFSMVVDGNRINKLSFLMNIIQIQNH
jgi:hypothetical protein